MCQFPCIHRFMWFEKMSDIVHKDMSDYVSLMTSLISSPDIIILTQFELGLITNFQESIRKEIGCK